MKKTLRNLRNTGTFYTKQHKNYDETDTLIVAQYSFCHIMKKVFNWGDFRPCGCVLFRS